MRTSSRPAPWSSVARADFFPQISATPELHRQRISANQSAGAASSSHGATFDTFSVPLDASWELDLWGRVRREVESARARLTASADDLESSKLTIQAEVAIDYFTLRSLDAQDQLLEETAVAYRRSLELTQNRRKGGIATDLDVSQAETQLATTEAQIPAVQLQRATFLHALAVLCGQPAPAFRAERHPGRARRRPERPSMPAPASRWPSPANCWNAGPILPPPSASWPPPTRMSAWPTPRSIRSLTLNGLAGFAVH